jgi:cobalt-zinc-cadmium efflux system membrane fusion protein
MRIVIILFIVVTFAGPVFAEELSVAGLVEADASVQMRAKASGTVGRIKVKEGDQVKEGVVMVELENKREKAFIELARAKIESARAGIAERRIALESSKKELERKEMMKTVIARKELENAQDHVLQYEAAVLLKENELHEAQAELNLRKAELENTYLRAPFDGVVTAIHVEEGETVRALEDLICDVYSLKKICVKAAIPVDFIKFVDQETPVSVQVEKEIELSGKRLKGKVQYINPTVEPTSRTFGARIEILEPDRLVRPGMRANVIFELPEGAVPPPMVPKY